MDGEREGWAWLERSGRSAATIEYHLSIFKKSLHLVVTLHVIKSNNHPPTPLLQPPGIFFPIMWCLIITPMRATSSMLLHKSLGVAALSTTKWLILHLCIGDMWNAINNVEGRLGFSALTVVAVLTSVINATNKYYGSLPLAGYLLGGTCVWLTIATGLIWNTWWINKRGVKRDYLLPMKESGEASPTRFIWEKAS